MHEPEQAALAPHQSGDRQGTSAHYSRRPYGLGAQKTLVAQFAIGSLGRGATYSVAM